MCLASRRGTWREIRIETCARANYRARRPRGASRLWRAHAGCLHVWPLEGLVITPALPQDKTSSAQSIAPVTRTSRMMSNGNHEDLRIALTNNDGVREAPEDQAFDSASPGNTGHGYQGDDFLLEQIERSIKSAFKFCSESRALHLISPRRLGRLLGCGGMNSHHAHQEPRMRARIRRRSSSRSIRFAVPESISASLRRISVSHAFSASGSAGPSRLVIRSYASSARSDSERCSASERTFSRVGLPIIFPR